MVKHVNYFGKCQCFNCKKRSFYASTWKTANSPVFIGLTFWKSFCCYCIFLTFTGIDESADALEDDLPNQANKQHGQAKVLSRNMGKTAVTKVDNSGHISSSVCNNVSSKEVADSEMSVLIDYNILDRMQQQLNESYKTQCDLVDKWQQSDSKVKELNALINQKENVFRGREDYLQGKICELKDTINKLLNKESDLIEQKGALKLKVKTLKKSQNKYRSMYRNEIEVRSKLEKELASAGEKSLKKHEKIMNILNNTDQDQIMTLARKRYFKN